MSEESTTPMEGTLDFDEGWEDTTGTEDAKTASETEGAGESGTHPIARSREFIKEIFPDRALENDQEYEDSLMEYLSNAKGRMAENDEANSAIAEILYDNPEFADVIDDLRSGVPLRVALAKQFDPEDLKVGDDEKDSEQYQTALSDRRKRREDSEARIKEYEENMKLSDEEARQFMADQGWDEAKSKDFTDWIEGFILDFSRGKISKPILSKLKQAFEFEEAVAEAKQDGKIDALNTAIEAKRVKQLENTDGMPTGSAGAVPAAEAPEQEAGYFDEVFDRIQKKKW